MALSGTAFVNFRKDGDDGSDGRGIAEQITYWAISASSATAPTYPSDPATAPSTSVWSTTAQTPTVAKPYLWTYTRTHWTSGTAWTQTTPAVISLRASDGKRGASLHRIYDWSEISSLTSLTLYSASGETDYFDIIYNGGGYFMPAKDGTVSSLGTPAKTNSNYELEENFAYIVTKAVIADSISMTDNDGAVVFEAKDGNVTCKTGNFENVKVSGNITASTLDLQSDKSAMIVSPGDTVTLPALEEGYARRVLLIINRLKRNTNYPITVQGEEDGVYIDKPKQQIIGDTAIQVYNTSQVYASDGGCDYEAVGFYYGGFTYWAIYKLSDATAATS